MKKLLNTLYITNELCYLSRDRENIVISIDGKEVKRLPIHILEGIICFNYNGVSPGVMKLCSENNISIAFLTPYGRFCARLTGKVNGNVYLRREQYRIADSDEKSLAIAKNCIIGKLHNSRKMLMRAVRDHKEKINSEVMNKTIENIKEQLEKIKLLDSKDSLRGIEGEAARSYFRNFNEMILTQKDIFLFNERTKRPPKDRVNALLSFLYSLLTYEVQSALESVGLDSYVGFFHTDRPGRPSLALDMMEELRGYMVDRLVLTLINKKQIDKKHFEEKENESVLLNEKGRNLVIEAWQKKKQEEMTHPFIDEKIQIGLLPYVQAQLLARVIRGDIEEYPPFML